MKRARIILTTLFLTFSLSGCSWQDIYSAEGISIYRVETESGKEIYAEMSILPVQLQEETEEYLTASEPITEYEVQLSDGISYGYYGMENEEPQAYAYTFGSLEEISDALSLDLLASNLLIYPESDKNFFLLYNTAGNRTVSIQGVKAKLEKDYQITYMDIYLCFGPETDHARYSLQNITDEADHMLYEVAGGEEAYLLYDLSVEKGTVFVRMDGAFYVWELKGIKDLEDLYEFADSIQWIKKANR